jgi:hypothetical protein
VSELDLTGLKTAAELIESLMKSLAIVGGGLWAYRRYFRQREGLAHIEFTVATTFVGRQNDHWLVELGACVENKGQALQKIQDFTFDLRTLDTGDAVVDGPERINHQVNFPNRVRKGSWLPADWGWTFIEPGVRTKYSYLASVPLSARFVLLHGRFGYGDAKREFHTAEAVAVVPDA